MPAAGFATFMVCIVRLNKRIRNVCVMKNVMLAVVSFLICAQVAAQRSIQSLVGRWGAVRATNDGSGLEVVDSTAIYLVYGTQKKKIDSYKADFTQSPVQFNFKVKDSTETLNLRSLLEFINDDLIKWQLFEGDAMPVHFVNDRGEILYLRRKK